MRKLTNWDELQQLKGVTSEGADLDFKETLDPTSEKTRIECAKDVVALANVLGGHIVIGASTELGGTRCTGFHGVDAERATKIVEMIEAQVKDRARPTPFLSTATINMPAVERATPKNVIVVAVEPSAAAPLGVSVRQDKAGHLVDKGWVFPYRVGSLTEYLTPDQFGAYESMSARRAAAMLRSIPDSERKAVVLRWTVRNIVGSQAAEHPHCDVEYLELDLGQNVAVFRDRAPNAPSFGVPLDGILSVWKGAQTQGGWQVTIDGVLKNQGTTRWEFHPS